MFDWFDINNFRAKLDHRLYDELKTEIIKSILSSILSELRT